MVQAQNMSKEPAYFQSLVEDMEIQNKRYSELHHRLGSVLQKLAEEQTEQKHPGAPTALGPVGYISTIKNNIEQYTALNSRVEDMVSKLEKLF